MEIKLEDTFEYFKENGFLKNEEAKKSIEAFLISQAVNFQKQKRFNQAIIAFSEALKINADNAFAYMSRGDCYTKSNMPLEAKSDYLEVKRIIEEGKDVHIKLNDSSISIGVYLKSIILAVNTLLRSDRNIEEEKDIIRDIYLEYSNGEELEVVDDEENSQRDLKKLSHCLERIAKVIFSPNPTEADCEGLSVDLRKILYDKTAEVDFKSEKIRRKTSNRKGSLLKRSFKNIMLPKIVGVENSKMFPDEILDRMGITSNFNIPFGNGPVVANPRVFLNIDDWLNQSAMIIAGKEYSIKEAFTLFANIDGAHTDTTERIKEKKSDDLGLILNDNLGYRLIFNIAEFLFIWLAQYGVLVEKFPILKVADKQLIYSDRYNGFVPEKRLS